MPPQELVTAGLDEVGWGALAGPIISVVAVFRARDLLLLPPGVKDSKKCTEKQRDMLYLPLLNTSYDLGVGHAWPWEIDTLGPAVALQLSYTRALAEIHPEKVPTLLYVDGKNRVKTWGGRQVVEPKADNTYREVSAASIVAKVFRDTLMTDYSKKIPFYNWQVNKGYGTPDHLAAIYKHGLVLDENDKSNYIHRKRFCSKALARRTRAMPVLQQTPEGETK